MELNGFEIDQYNVHGIKEGASTSTCPSCSESRKQSNKKQKCAKVFWDSGLIQCSHCGDRIQMHTYKTNETNQEKVYKKPSEAEVYGKLSKTTLDWFKNIRGISKETLERMKVSEVVKWMPKAKAEVPTICFNYYLNNNLTNVKFRAKDKDFALFGGGEKIFYNIDNIATSKECIVVEGEPDALSWAEVGVYEVVSVPNGFNDKGTINLDYLDHYLNYFENKDTIYLALDKDAAGQLGEKEFIRRLGVDKCKIINFSKGVKDSNQQLVEHGPESLLKCKENAKEVEFEGIFSIKDTKDILRHQLIYGQKKGTTTHVPELDKAFKWRTGEVTIFTGYQNEGKSAILNQMLLLRALYEDTKCGFFSPESLPMDDFYTELIENLIGVRAEAHLMPVIEHEFAMSKLEQNFFLVNPEKDFKLESIFERARFLVRKHGIRVFVIDPYNTVEHKITGSREDLYISKFMAELKRLAVELDIAIVLVAHQVTAKIDLKSGDYYKPNLNTIKGGGTFSDKADNVVVIWRPFRLSDPFNTEVVFASQKIKKQKLVARPTEVSGIKYNVNNGRYIFESGCPFAYFDEQRTIELNKETPEQTEARKKQETLDKFEQEPESLPFMDPNDAFDLEETEVVEVGPDLSFFDEIDPDKMPF